MIQRARIFLRLAMVSFLCSGAFAQSLDGITHVKGSEDPGAISTATLMTLFFSEVTSFERQYPGKGTARLRVILGADHATARALLGFMQSELDQMRLQGLKSTEARLCRSGRELSSISAVAQAFREIRADSEAYRNEMVSKAIAQFGTASVDALKAFLLKERLPFTSTTATDYDVALAAANRKPADVLASICPGNMAGL